MVAPAPLQDLTIPLVCSEKGQFMNEPSAHPSEMTSRTAVTLDTGKLLLLDHLFPTFYAALWNLLAGDPNRPLRLEIPTVIAFTSANHGEGTSTMALNFSLAFALNSIRKAVLIDAHIGSPSLHEAFGVTGENGFMELLTGEKSLDEVLVKDRLSPLSFVPAGAGVENPIPLYESPALAAVFKALRERFDVILLDVGPILRYPDMVVLMSKVDGVILVLQAESTKWEVAQHAKSCLERANVPVLGAILNRKEYFIPNMIYRLL